MSNDQLCVCNDGAGCDQTQQVDGEDDSHFDFKLADGVGLGLNCALGLNGEHGQVDLWFGRPAL